MDTDRKLIKFSFLTYEEIASHYHQNMEIIYLLKGKMKIQIDEMCYELNDGDYIFINANKRHKIESQGVLLGARFEIDFHMIAEYMGTIQLMFWCNTVTDKKDAYQELRKILDRILERYYEQDEKGALYLNALYFEMAYILTSNFMIKADEEHVLVNSTSKQLRLSQIQNYIQANYQNQISLYDLAQKLYLSNAYLSKYIKKNLGLTFLEYLNNIRLFHAVDELLYSSKSLTRIAMDNGFPTSAAFTKIFQAVHGESPSAYRKKMHEQSDSNKDDKKRKELDEKLIQEYLKLKKNEENSEVKGEALYELNVEKYHERKEDFNRAINIGEAYSLLQAQVQKQLLEMQKENGISYVRIWNVLTKEHCYDEIKKYNFREIDLVLDFLLEHNLIPYIELGLKPKLFIYTPEKNHVNREAGREGFEGDQFFDMIKHFCLHLINRYGIEEIEKWYFEYWNDPKLEICSEAGSYYTNFDTIYVTLKSLSLNIKIGGAGFILGYDSEIYEKALKIWKGRNIKPDFLSFCSFQYLAYLDNGKRYGQKSIDGDYIKNQIELLKVMLKEIDFEVKELHIDEWNFTVSNKNSLNDSCEQGAYILKNCIDMEGTIDFMAYWHGLDICSECYDSHAILNGDSGILSRDGIKKPSFYAFHFYHMLCPKCITKDSNAIVTTNGRDRITIACHNYKKLSARYVFAKEDTIERGEVDNYIENPDSLALKFQFTNMKDGAYLIKMYYINKENGSSQDAWSKMDFIKELSKNEIDYLKNSAIPTMEMKMMTVQDGKCNLDIILKATEIRLIDILYRYHV